MNYKKWLDKNDSFIFCNSMPCMKNMCKKKVCFFVFVTIAVIFLLLSVLYMILKDNNSSNRILLSRESMLNAKLTRLENVNDMLEAEILLLRNEAKSLSRKKDKKKLAKISKYLADTEVVGNGISIMLYDNYSNFMPSQDSSTIIHNIDLLKFVNFLWSKNSTAISINGERIVPNTSISCVGPTIIINQKRVNSPFNILAIGGEFDLEEMQNDVFVLSLKYRGIEVKIKKKEDITIPAGKYVTFME